MGEADLTIRRLLGVCGFLLAALSTARADVQTIAPSSKANVIDFVYSPDRTPSESWFGLLLRETGLDIWIEMLRDEFFVDTTDDLNRAAFAASLGGLTLSN